MHHSTEKLDAFGANYLHPVDLFFFTTWSSLVFFPLLGLAPEAGAIAATWLAFNAMFQHANIRTPYWLGYIVQRPESHLVHHNRGKHHHNYANLPLWDMIFGTFRNQRSVEGYESGFYRGADHRHAVIPRCFAAGASDGEGRCAIAGSGLTGNRRGAGCRA